MNRPTCIHPSTSMEAYFNHSTPTEEGKSPKQLQQEGIMECFKIKPDLNVTCMELVYFLKANNIKAFPSRNYEFVYHQVHKRMRELEGIETLEKRICIYQLRRCNVWSLKK